MEEKINFQKEMEKLNEIANKIENNSLSLEESLSLYEEGASIIKNLEKALKEAENKVETIIKSSKN